MKNVLVKTVTIEKEEWEKILDSTFKKHNKDVTIEGFRKGHAPKEMFIKKFGIESLYMDAVDAALPKAYSKVMEEDKLELACEPKIDVKGIDAEHVEFEFTIITKPEVKLDKYKKLGVKKEEPKVTKEEIKDEIEHMRGHLAEIVEKSGKVEKGDIAVIDFEGFVDGEAFDGGKGTDYSLEIGSNTFIPGFEDGLIGAETGKEIEVKVTFPEDYVENLKGKDAVFKVTVKKIKARVLPEINEEFFKDLGYDDVKTQAELEKKVEEHLLEHKKEDAENKYIDELIEAGIKNMKVDINEEIIDEEVSRMVKDLSNRLEAQGIPIDSYLEFTGSSMDKFREQAKPEAEKRIKSRYLLDEIIKKENLTATDEEAKEHAKNQAEKYGCSSEEIIEMYGGMDVVKYDLLIHKAVEVLEG